MVVVLFQALPGSSVHLPSCFIAHELDIPLLATKLAEIHKLRNYCYDKDYYDYYLPSIIKARNQA